MFGVILDNVLRWLSEDIGMFSALYQTSKVLQYPSNPFPLYPCILCTPSPCWVILHNKTFST